MSYTLKQVAEHNNSQSCWVIIKDKVYDVTEFLPAHPGGAKIILKYAGKDATSAYEPIHPPDALEKNLPPEKHLGSLTSDAAASINEVQKNRKKTKDELRVEQAYRERLPLRRILSHAGCRPESIVLQSVGVLLVRKYINPALAENARAFSRLFFHARVLRPISQCDTSTTILGFKSRIPVFVSGAALAKLGHPLGEVNITRGSASAGIIQMVSSNASLSASDIAAARVSPDQPLFFQLYKRRDNEQAAERVREIEQLGYNAIFLTVDAPVAGNRERDVRAPYELEEQEREGHASNSKEGLMKPEDIESLEDDTDAGGTAGALLKLDDQDMTWERTIPWLRSVTKLPIVLKGIQCVEDAVLAAEAGVDGILISNHGGRQLEFSMPSIEVLYRIRKQRPDVFDKLEVYMDGGVRRGTDVLKALCLGAKAVGLGRPFLYAQSAYGEAGVIKIVQILEREMITGMRLLGATKVEELVPEMVEKVDWQPLLAKL